MSNDPKKSLINRLASRYHVDAVKFYETLKATAFKQRDGSAPTNEQMLALMVVAEQYNLNPFTREIYAFPDKQNGIIPVVGVDGWSRIINDHPEYDGVEFVYASEMAQPPGAKVSCPVWIEAVLYRKDRSRPTRIREFLDEVYRAPFEGRGNNGTYTIEGPWQTHTKRQLRHKALIQCSRVAFGFSGIYDPDEAERIREMEQASAINPAVAQLTHAAKADDRPLQIDHKKMDAVLERLVSRVSTDNAWGAANDYVSQRFQGDELKYAVQYLREKQMDTMEAPINGYEQYQAAKDGELTGTVPETEIDDAQFEDVPQ